LAQINEIDMSTPHLLAETDAKLIEQMTLARYFWLIYMTVIGSGAGDRVK
jgi:hypothetical protein